jgi:cathepsin B
LKYVVAGTVATAVSALHPISEEMIKAIQERQPSWKTMDINENPLKDKTVEELMGLMGSYIVEDNEIYATPNYDYSAVPDSHDARDKWGTKIHEIRDQQSCGSCWAFGASEALTDRHAIHGLDEKIILSPQDMVSCDTSNLGCSGGYLNRAWNYLTTTGIVEDSCFPYTAGSGKAEACRSTCVNGAPFKKYKCAAGSVVHPLTVANIKAELYNNGPLEGAFTVYNDFFNYAGGVYHHVSGGVAGGHAIKVLGYGTLNGENYWLCANSWGKTWGESGFFKIRQGDSGIDQQMYGCTPAAVSEEIAFE